METLPIFIAVCVATVLTNGFIVYSAIRYYTYCQKKVLENERGMYNEIATHNQNFLKEIVKFQQNGDREPAALLKTRVNGKPTGNGETGGLDS